MQKGEFEGRGENRESGEVVDKSLIKEQRGEPRAKCELNNYKQRERNREQLKENREMRDEGGRQHDVLVGGGWPHVDARCVVLWSQLTRPRDGGETMG